MPILSCHRGSLRREKWVGVAGEGKEGAVEVRPHGIAGILGNNNHNDDDNEDGDGKDTQGHNNQPVVGCIPGREGG